jgi:hypothetical protein
MPAGRRDSTHPHEYARRVAAFDWSEFLTEWEGDLFLKELRGGLLNAADLVLIDSSAGLSSSSGVCTTLLADVVIMFCPPSTKSLERTVQTARELLSPIVFERRGGRPLDLLVVPARIDYGEAELLNDFKHRFLESLNGFVPTQIGDPAAFWNLRIPNIQYFAYRESLVIERPDEAISEPLVEAYQRLTATLKRLRRDASVPADQEAPKFDHSRSTSLARFRALRARKTDTPTVFISYAREDEIVVRTLYNRLIEAGFKAWLDTEHLLGGQPWETVIEERIESSDLVLVCLSHVAVAKKGFIQRELKKTLEVVDLQPEHAVFLIPVRLDACEIPRSLRKFNCIDLFEQNGAAKLDASIRYAWRQSRAAKT